MEALFFPNLEHLSGRRSPPPISNIDCLAKARKNKNFLIE